MQNDFQHLETDSRQKQSGLRLFNKTISYYFFETPCNGSGDIAFNKLIADPPVVDTFFKSP